MCWAAHCSTLWLSRARVYFDGEGRQGAVKSHSSILQFTTSLPPFFYFHCATAGTCLLPLVLQIARISVFFEASKILPHQIKKMLCSHRGSESICGQKQVAQELFLKFCIIKLCNRRCQDCSAVQEEISLTVFVCFSYWVKNFKKETFRKRELRNTQ